MTRFVLICLVAFVALTVPVTAYAAPQFLPLVRCGGYDSSGVAQDPCTPCDVFQTLENIINLILFGVTTPVAAFLIVVAGGMMLLSRGNPAQFAQGRTLLTNTLIGVAIILLSWVAASTLIKILGGSTTNNSWLISGFSCPAELRNITNKEDLIFSVAPTTVPVLPSPRLPEVGVGTLCSDSALDLCSTSTAQCGQCGDFQAQFQQYGSGVATPKLLNAIMFAESSCGRNTKSPAGAYGAMQMLPETAAKTATLAVRNQCHLYARNKDGTDNLNRPDTINAGWLLQADPVGIGKVICLAAAYINQEVAPSCASGGLRSIAAGYNTNPKWCAPSASCPGAISCDGGTMRAWECLWDNREHTRCNEDREGSNLRETRVYAPKVAACAQ